MNTTGSRAAFVLGALASGVAAFPRAAGAVSQGRALPGPYCIKLSKAAAELQYEFVLPFLDGDGDAFVLSGLRGTAVWLNFFTSWCPPCNAEAERLVQLADHYRPYGLSTIGVSVGEKAEPVRAFRDRHKVTYPIVMDRDEHVFNALGFYGFPTQMFLDRQGHITCVVVNELAFGTMDNEIAVALGGNSIPLAPSPGASAGASASSAAAPLETPSP